MLGIVLAFAVTKKRHLRDERALRLCPILSRMRARVCVEMIESVFLGGGRGNESEGQRKNGGGECEGRWGGG